MCYLFVCPPFLPELEVLLLKLAQKGRSATSIKPQVSEGNTQVYHTTAVAEEAEVGAMSSSWVPARV